MKKAYELKKLGDKKVVIDSVFIIMPDNFKRLKTYCITYDIGHVSEQQPMFSFSLDIDVDKTHLVEVAETIKNIAVDNQQKISEEIKALGSSITFHKKELKRIVITLGKNNDYMSLLEKYLSIYGF